MSETRARLKDTRSVNPAASAYEAHEECLKMRDTFLHFRYPRVGTALMAR